MWPGVGMRQARMFSRVVLPDPLAPIIALIYPLGNIPDIGQRICFGSLVWP